MPRTINALVWVLFCLTFYLIASEAASPWFSLPGLGNIGFTLVFVAFAIVHCALVNGWQRTGFFFASAAVVSYAMEEIGTRTGLVYGPYHYSDMLGPKLGHVPVLIPLAWFMMIYPSWVTAKAMLRGVDTACGSGIVALAVTAATVMTAWDTVMDPGMAAAGNWVWEQGGPYFGVPLLNYFGWLLTTFLVYLAAGIIWRGTQQKRSVTNAGAIAVMPLIIYTIHGIRYVTAGSIVALHVVALFAMVLPGVVALMQMSLPRAHEA